MEEKVKEIAECSICTDLFTDPRMLPCIHTFCLKCLNETSISSAKKPGDSMQCPICRDPFVIPKEGIDGLKKNFFMEKLVEVTKISKCSENAVSCDICTEDNEEELANVPQASQYCVQCQQNICIRCVKEHKRMKLLKEHQLILIGSPVKEELIKRFAVQHCAQHNTETAKLYCFDCKQIICVICFAEEHKSHECSDINKVGDTIREELLGDLKQMKNFSQEAFEKCQKIQKEQNEFQIRVEKIEKEIINRGNELKELVDKSTTSLLNELTSLKQNGLKQWEIEKEETERHKATVESLELYLNELVSKGSSAELCRIVGDLHSRNEDLHKSHRDNIRQNVSSTEISFESSNLKDFLGTDNIVGVIKVTASSKLEDVVEGQTGGECVSASISLLRRLDLSVSSPNNVTGITELKHNIYILCSYPNSILVFKNQFPFRFQKKIEITAIAQPWDLVSSDKSKCLYISDRSSRCIWKLAIEDDGLHQWVTNTDSPFTLSVTTDDHILITKNSQQRSQLEIFASDGTQIRSLILPVDIQKTLHCIEKSNGDFIISHSDRKTKQLTISQLSSDGQNIIRQFRPKDDTEVMKDPGQLSPDSMNNRLFVADTQNHRVILLDLNSLEFKQILFTNEKHGMLCPWRLFYGSKEKLIVRFFDYTPQVLVFRITMKFHKDVY